MNNLEISQLLQDAKDASIKVISEQEVSVEDLESIFKVVNYNKNDLWETLSSNSESIKNKLISSIEAAADVIVEYMYSTLLGNKSIAVIFIQDVLSGWDTMNTLLNNPHTLLSDDLKMKDEQAINAVNNKLATKVEEALDTMDQTKFDALETEELEKISTQLDSLWYLDDDVKSSIGVLVSWALFWKIAPELENYSKDFSEEIKKATIASDITFNVKKWKDDFFDLVRKIEATSITRGSAAEEYMKDCKNKFENQFDEALINLIKKIVETNVVKELDSCEDLGDIESYCKNNEVFRRIKSEWPSYIFDWDKKSEISGYINEKVKSAKITIKSRPPRVKEFTDTVGNKYAKFKDEVIPVAHHERKTHKWRMEPKRLSDWNVVVTFRDITSGKVIEPNMTKRLRLDDPYEMTVEEWKQVQRDNKTYTKKVKEIDALKLEIEKEQDAEKKKELVVKLKDLLQDLPHFARVLDKLGMFDAEMWDYIEDKVPDFDEQRTKTTPDIMENLREMTECANTILKSQHDGLIIEWEAWVWKNVLIDIFAHFTNRPVFVFSCGKRTDIQDLTHLWVLDENGSKKINSKVVDAIHTPNAILVLDEFNTLDPGIQKRLNWLFDGRKSLVLDQEEKQSEKALESVLIMWTMNPQWYSGVQVLPQDVRSRFHIIYHDYDWIVHPTETGDFEISYSDALKTYGNVKYFWKLAAGNWFTKEDIELYEQALLDQVHGNRLTPEKKKILKNFKPITDTDFVWAWNNLFNWWSEEEVRNRFWDTFISWMEDLYTMMLYANYIRLRYKASKEGWEDGLPWDEDTNDLFEDISFSPRLAIQALEQLHNGWLSPEEAIIETYVGQLSDVNSRPKVVEYLNTLSKGKILSAFKNRTVQEKLKHKNVSHPNDRDDD